MWKTEQTSNVGFMLLNLIAIDLFITVEFYVCPKENNTKDKCLLGLNLWWTELFTSPSFCKPHYMWTVMVIPIRMSCTLL
jgi:hypothetical protein